MAAQKDAVDQAAWTVQEYGPAIRMCRAKLSALVTKGGSSAPQSVLLGRSRRIIESPQAYLARIAEQAQRDAAIAVATPKQLRRAARQHSVQSEAQA